jgi:hypothetical protein
MRTLNRTVLAKDLPDWAVKSFENIDYDSLNSLTRMSLLASLKMWCNSQPQRRSNYDAVEKSTPIPQDLANVINMVDFNKMTRESTMIAKSFLTNQLWLFAPKYKG